MHPDFCLCLPWLRSPPAAARGYLETASVRYVHASVAAGMQHPTGVEPPPERRYSAQQGQSSGTNSVSVAEYCVRS